MDDFVEVRKYVYAVFRWWWLIILFAIVSGTVGFEVGKRQTPVYQATTTLMVGQSIQAIDLTKTDIQTSELLALTYADIARRQPLLQGVIDALNLDVSVRALRKRVTIEPVTGTQLLELTVEAGSFEEAQQIADELAHQLIQLSPSRIHNEAETEKQQFINQRLESLQTKIEKGRRRLHTLEMGMNDSLSVDQLNELQREIDTLENMIFDWEDSYTQMLIFNDSQQSPNYLTVIETAQGSTNPVRPDPKLFALLASAVGLLLGLGFVFVREYLDNTIKTGDDLRAYLGLTPLGTIRQIKGEDIQDKLIISQNLFSPWSEAYRMIRSNLQFRSIDQSARSIMITSALPGEGKSTVVANLGIVMAQTNLKTVIVDADLRRPTLHNIFQVSNLGGLTDYLRAPEPDFNSYLKKTYVNDLYLLTPGVLPPNPSELLGSQRMNQLLASLREFADVVIFDTPPAAVFSDAAVLSTKVDGVVLVTLAKQTRLAAVQQATLNLQHVGANIFGGILNGVTFNADEPYYQSYYSFPNLSRPQFGNPLTQLPRLRRWRQWLPFSK